MIISFSGIDCCGKSSQIQLLVEYFREHGERPMHFWRKSPFEPRARATYVWIRGGYTPLFSAVKRMWRRLSPEVVPSARTSDAREKIMSRKFWRRLWLHIAIFDLFFECVVRVRFYSLLGAAVVSDRYWWDSEVDFRVNFPCEEFWNWLSWKLLKSCAAVPDNSFLIQVPLEESVRRSELKLFCVRRSNDESNDARDLLEQHARLFAPILTHQRPITQINEAFALNESYGDGMAKMLVIPDGSE